MTALLSAEQLRVIIDTDKNYLSTVDGIDFQITRGERIGIVGESGSGKSQLILSLHGMNNGEPGLVAGKVFWKDKLLIEPEAQFITRVDDGNRLLLRKDYKKWFRTIRESYSPILGRHIGMLFQEPKSSLIPYQTIREHFRESFRKYEGRFGHAELNGTLDILKRLHFVDPVQILDKYPHQLSGGQSQRVALALALTGKPELLIADEPTSALDSVSQRFVLKLILETVESLGMSLIFITHDIHLLKFIADRVVVIYAGKKMEEIPAIYLDREYRQKLHPYTRYLLNASDHLWGEKNGFISIGAENGVPVNGCPFYSSCPFVKKESVEFRNRCRNVLPPPVKRDESHINYCWLGYE